MKLIVTSKFSAYLIILITTLIGSSTILLGKIALIDISPFGLMSLRFFLAALILGLILGKKSVKLNKQELKGGLSVGITFGIGCSLIYFGLKTVQPGLANFLISLEVSLIPILMFFIWGVKPLTKEIIALVLAILGMILLTEVHSFKIQLGEILILASAISYAFYAIALSKFSPNCDSKKLSFVALSVIGIISTIFYLFESGFIFPNITLKVWFIIFYLAVIGSIARFVLQSIGQKIATPTETGLIFSMEPVFTMLGSYYFNNEIITNFQMIGAILLIISAILATLYGRGEMQLDT
jgi:drug/metabolite transporter (DMT)-like permease